MEKRKLAKIPREEASDEMVQNILSTITCFSQRIRKGTPSTVCLLEKGICGMEQL